VLKRCGEVLMIGVKLVGALAKGVVGFRGFARRE